MNCVKKILTLDEIQTELERISHIDGLDDVDVSIIPPNPDPMTDEEDFIDENVMEDNEVGDVVGTLELNIADDSQQPSIINELTNNTDRTKISAYRVRGTSAANKIKTVCNSSVKTSKWKKCDPSYSYTSSSTVDQFGKVAGNLNGKTEVEIFETFFSDEIFDLIIQQSKIYASQKNNLKFSVNKDELRSFIGILLLSGYHRLPQEDMYWEQAADVGVPIVYQSMPKNRFREIKKYLHLNNNSNIDKNDKMFKVTPYFNILRENFQRYGIFHSHLSIDEMMVKYYGKHPVKMYMKGKPIKFGYKIWCLCSSNGYLYDYIPYCGKDSNAEKQPLGLKVIDSLTNSIPKDELTQHEIYFDNFFTSIELLTLLKEKKIKATGTVRVNRTGHCPLIDPKVMEKEKERGFHDFQFDKANEVMFVRWKDSKAVTVGTNFSTVTPLGKAKRYSAKEKKEISIPIPKLIQEYNSYMGGVDLLDKQVSLYRIRIRSKKWWWPLFTQMIDIAVVNTWRIYQVANSEEKYASCLQTRRRIVLYYLSKRTSSVPKRPGPQASKLMGGRVNDSIRLDEGNHFIMTRDTQRICASCKKKTKKYCTRCDVPLHEVCFQKFHIP